jgi:hypothetical protein
MVKHSGPFGVQVIPRAPLLAGGFRCFLGEGCGDEGRDHAPAALAGMGEDIAHEVDAATLPGCAQHLRDSCLQAKVRIRDDQLHSAQAAAGQAVQELGPDRLSLRLRLIDPYLTEPHKVAQKHRSPLTHIVCGPRVL